MFKYQLMIADFYKNYIWMLKILFRQRTICASLWKLATLLEARIKPKKNYCVLEFNQSQWLKPYVKLNTQKIIRAEKMVTKIGKHCTNYWTMLIMIWWWYGKAKLH